VAIIDLPYQDIIDRESGATSDSFDLNEIVYSGKVSQRTFNGPSIEASRNSIWKVSWKLLEFDKGQGVDHDIEVVREFYKLAYINKVRWKPFDIPQTRIWRIVPNSYKESNTAGTIFEASLSLEYLYNE
tara:strand:+ start:84656 stop:85042 length:387 start_codon:yes stop_codon:yes gene_type:complete